ncbi:MAG: hypothetical protein ACFE9N_10770 [Promethearchaeota archaeon]
MNSIQERKFKKGIMNYIDIVFAFCHSIIIIFPLIIIRNNLVLEIIEIAITSILLFSIIFRSITKNPFYISYGIALLISNFLFLIPSVILVPLISIFLIPEICYIIILTWNSRIFSSSKFYGDAQYRARAGSYGLPPNPDPNLKLREGLQSKQVEKQYNAKRHALLSFILLIVLVVVFILWYNPSLLYSF